MHMHKSCTLILFCSLAFVLTPTKLMSQKISFEKFFIRSSMGNYGYSVQQTLDGGYIIAGATSTDPRHGRPQVYLIKTNEYGDTLWTNIFLSGLSSSGYSVRQCSDRGYIIIGSNSYFGPFGNDFVAIKTDSLGSEQWNKIYNIDFTDQGTCVQQTSDGGFIIAGYSYATLDNDSCGVLIRLNAFGDTVWTKLFRTNRSITFNDLLITNDGGYLLAGSYSDSAWIVKTDSLGNVLWSKLYGGGNITFAMSIRQTLDDGLIVTGFIMQCNDDSCRIIYLQKLDDTRAVEWTHFYPANGNYFTQGNPNNVIVRQTSDSGFFIMTNRTTPYVEIRIYLLKTNSCGDTVWTRLYGNAGGNTTANSAEQTSDGGFIITGSSYPAVYLLKITDDGLLSVGKNNDILPTQYVLDQNYPNPFNSMTIISYQLPFHSKVTLKVFDLLGREVFVLVNSIEEPGYKSVSLNGNDLASGLYYYRLQVDNYVATKKLLLIK